MGRAAALIAIFAHASCAVVRPLVDGKNRCASWEQEIQPAFATRCGTCHAGDSPAAGYLVVDYLSVLSAAVEGDAESRLLTELDPSIATGPHLAYADLYPLVKDWVVECKLALSSTGIHPAGISNPASVDFHGKWLAGSGYDFAQCQQCHGDDFSGGIANASCTECHAQRPTACGTCHALPPETNAHAAHKELVCSECHVAPTTYDAPGHLVPDADHPLVQFGDFARTGGLTPTWSQETQSCQVYCHLPSTPSWTSKTTLGCDGCHAYPPPNHASDKCEQCHDKAGHFDGVVTLGDGSGTCTSCHKNTSGAHVAHTSSSLLRGPISCSECHLVPHELASAGHIDSPPPAEVLPAANWNGATCTNACHGSELAAHDASPNRIRTVAWNPPTKNAAACGACHGIPPINASHTGSIGLSQCASCHAESVDAYGRILVPGSHMDGVVQAP